MNDKTGTNNNLEANILIMGGGGSGFAAAAAAAEKGVTGIIVLEKEGHFGGNSIMAQGLFACESTVQKRELVECFVDDCYRILMNWAHWSRIDASVARAFIKKSGDTIRWLEEKGLEFELRQSYPNQTPTWHIPEGMGARLLKVLIKQCEDQGVEVILNSRGQRIMRDDKGRVSGVLALTKEGEEFEIKTKSIIIATGGFGGNKELLKKYCPAYYDGMRLDGKSLGGDGLIMASEAGAAIADSIPILGGGRGGPDIKIAGTMKSRRAGSLAGISGEPYTIWINKKGRRFVDEGAFEGRNAGALQPDRVTYTVFDDRIRQDMEEKGIRIGMGTPEEVRAQRRGLPGLMEELREMEKEIYGKPLKIADSWDEMAEYIGADPEVLKSAIEEYNHFCELGYDEAFAKERRYLIPLLRSPYYAIKCIPSFHDTIGGIKVSEKMEVRDGSANVIPGLYSAGVISDGWQTDDYCWMLPGSAFGFAINSGRIAGESASDYITSQSK